MNSGASNKLSSYEIVLGQNISSLKGIAWPKYSNGSPLEFKVIEDPFEILLYLPKGRQLKFEARKAALKQNDNVLNSVRITLPVDGVEYDQAISILDTEYSKIGGQRDNEFAHTVQRWRTAMRTPGWPDTRMTRVVLEGGVKLELGIESVYDRGTDKWVSFLQFYMD